jgi:hypothetical protein
MGDESNGRPLLCLDVFVLLYFYATIPVYRRLYNTITRWATGGDENWASERKKA